MKKVLVIFLLLLMLTLSSCVPGRGKYTEDKAGFWPGVWHGAIAPVTMVIGIFDKETRIYETDNKGRGYDIGFILGIFLVWGGSSSHCYYRGRRR